MIIRRIKDGPVLILCDLCREMIAEIKAQDFELSGLDDRGLNMICLDCSSKRVIDAASSD